MTVQVQQAIPISGVTPDTRSRTQRRLQRAGKMNAHGLARGLGWFSIGLGLAELLAPRRLGRAIGVNSHPLLLPMLGLREISSGVAILSSPHPAGAVRSRVAGDVIDLGLLGYALTKSSARGRVAAATGAVLGVTALDVLCGKLLSQRKASVAWRDGRLQLRKSVTVNRGPDELYAHCRQLENLPRMLSHLQSVAASDDGRSAHWIARLPSGTTLEWDAEVTVDDPDERLGWRSAPGSELSHEGTLSFRALPGGRGTVVTLELALTAQGAARRTMEGLLGAWPEMQLENDLREFKMLMEAGEIATTEGQPAGRRSMISRHLP